MAAGVRTGLALAAAVALAGVLLVGCSPTSREKALSIFFDGVVKSAPPPRRRVRRELLREIEDLKRQLAEAQTATKPRTTKEATREGGPPPAEQAKTWKEAEELLPKAADGGVDWMQALRDGTIAPRPGAEPDAQLQPALQLDVERVPEAGELFKVVFPHEAHTTWLSCVTCHAGLFQMQRGATPMSMDQINAGELCGKCHGTVAFPPTACGRCHPAMAVPAAAASEPAQEQAPAGGQVHAAENLLPIERMQSWPEAEALLPKGPDGSVDWMQALKDGTIAPRPGAEPDAEEQPILQVDVERIPAAGEMFKVIFPHAAHTTWLSCPSCHPAPFEMQRGATPMSMDKINAGELCGKCHGTVAFPPTACGRCHPAMAGG